MDAAFDSMMDIINNIDEFNYCEAGNDYDSQIIVAAQEMRRLDAPIIKKSERKHVPPTIKVAEFDAENNLLDMSIREQFKNECIFNETRIFTKPIPTTNTMKGYLSNVSFYEQQLIGEVLPDGDVLAYKCNYGNILHDEYKEPVKIRTTNRGRKKKDKPKKDRKVQGNGKSFNSQITFIIKSNYKSLAESPLARTVDTYKFKIFRTGKIQLPGAKQHLIDDIIERAHTIARILNMYLHPGEYDLTKLTNVININPIMKNYKFMVKLSFGYIIDLMELKNILIAEMRNQSTESTAPKPQIFMVKYNRQDTKLSIKFVTPIYKNQTKKTRVNIFMRGKINILGASQADMTAQICKYLHGLFEQNCKKLVVPNGETNIIKLFKNYPKTMNIVQEDTYDRIIHDFTHWTPDLPHLSVDEYNNIMQFVNQIYCEKWRAADNYLRAIFAGSAIGQLLGV